MYLGDFDVTLLIHFQISKRGGRGGRESLGVCSWLAFLYTKTPALMHQEIKLPPLMSPLSLQRLTQIPTHKIPTRYNRQNLTQIPRITRTLISIRTAVRVTVQSRVSHIHRRTGLVGAVIVAFLPRPDPEDGARTQVACWGIEVGFGFFEAADVAEFGPRGAAGGGAGLRWCVGCGCGCCYEGGGVWEVVLFVVGLSG